MPRPTTNRHGRRLQHLPDVELGGNPNITPVAALQPGEASDDRGDDGDGMPGRPGLRGACSMPSRTYRFDRYLIFGPGAPLRAG